MATMSTPKTLTLILLLNLLLPSQSETVYDLLPRYGLPRGLLPSAVKSYSLSSNGEFVVELTSTCYVHFLSNLVYYEKKITGKVSYGQITDIEGIQAKKLFLWTSVTKIVAHPADETIEFYVGFLSESLQASEFEEVPACKSKVGGCRGVDGVLKEEALAVAEV
ncbi:uncharacterized protein LOC109833372 [Asparagus officinalis]|uniref:uncharacterized protein LOC109833372 n=1 Tax=Asparagus officinalis TaxID=4686 RepID=UPI00098E68DB|nr:uncharacterized protein LOC109833372 [Asparagus officinalis]